MTPNAYVVVRMRGQRGVARRVEDTMRTLRLNRKHHATLALPEQSVKGVLKAGKDHLIWGPADTELIELLLSKRGKTEGGDHLTEENLKERTGFESIAELAEDLAEGRARLHEIGGIRPVFTLSPPRGGFKSSTKRTAGLGGQLGFREDIGEVVERMT